MAWIWVRRQDCTACRQRCSELEQALESKQGSGSDQDTEETHHVGAEAIDARANGNGNAAKEQVENLEQELKVMI